MIINELEKSYKAIAFLRRNWDNPLTPTLLVVLAVVGGFVLAYHIDIFGVEAQVSLGEGTLIAAICLLVLLTWFFSSRPRKTVGGKIGIVVAIGCESKDEEIKLHSDFVEALRDQIARTTRKYFDVYELSQYHTRKIHSHEEATRYLALTRAHLIIFGRCKLRNHKGQLTYTVDFQEVIRHAPIPNEVQEELRRDMQLAFPTRMLIPQQNELEGFEITKDIFGIASQFTLGIASLLSGDPLTAFDLHQTAYREASAKIDVDDNSPEVLKRYKARLAKCLVLSGLHATQVYYKSKQHGYLGKMEHFLRPTISLDTHLGHTAAI